jgi:hypothetical protein
MSEDIKDQPPPIPNDRPAVWDLVIADMRARDQTGRHRYGTPLQPHNGRDALADAYQEALDLVVYLRQEIAEREDLRAERDKLRAFKDWVHAFLDAQGIPADPDPEETAWTGCRIGCRMRYLTAERDRLRAQIKGHCDRIAAQSELLSRRAEAP